MKSLDMYWSASPGQGVGGLFEERAGSVGLFEERAGSVGLFEERAGSARPFDGRGWNTASRFSRQARFASAVSQESMQSRWAAITSSTLARGSR
jgi:hypothetical protein